MNQNSIEQYERISDELASRGFACIDHFLTSSETDEILQTSEFSNGLANFKKAGTGAGRQINEGIRGDFIQWIDKRAASSPIQLFLSRLQELQEFLNQALFLSLKDFEVHTTVYPAGTFYKRHLDQFKATDHRKLSVICYLNTGWEENHGGQLRMFLPEGPHDIFPISGRLVCFRSDQIEHEVLPATRDRLSITGWMLDQLRD